MTDPRALTDAEQEIWRAYFYTRRAVNRALDEQAAEFDVSLSELEVLISLIRLPERRSRVRDLAGYLGWERSRLSHLVTRMVRRGLVVRHTVEGGPRATDIGLTSEGRRIVVRALPGHIATIRGVFLDPLDEELQASVLELSRRTTEAAAAFKAPSAK